MWYWFEVCVEMSGSRDQREIISLNLSVGGCEVAKEAPSLGNVSVSRNLPSSLREEEVRRFGQENHTVQQEFPWSRYEREG